jgi:hypothetical protein
MFNPIYAGSTPQTRLVVQNQDPEPAAVPERFEAHPEGRPSRLQPTDSMGASSGNLTTYSVARIDTFGDSARLLLVLCG